MPFNLFQNTRLGNIMTKPTMGSGNPLDSFNPMTDTSSSPFSQGGLATQNQKRLFSGIVPQADKNALTPSASSSPGTEGDSMMRYYDILQKMGQDRPATNAYRDAVANAPRYDDYRPSKLRAVGAAIAGAAGGLNGGAGTGVAVAENFLNTPYKNALQDYETRTRGMESAAQIEQSDIQDSRQNFITAAGIGDRKDDTQLRRLIAAREAEQRDRELGQGDVRISNEGRQIDNQGRGIDNELILGNARNANDATRNSNDFTLGTGRNRNDANANANTAAYQQGQLNIGTREVAAREMDARTNRIEAEAKDWEARHPVGKQRSYMDPDEAWDFVMDQLSQDAQMRKYITPDNTGFGSRFTVDAAHAPQVQEMAARRAAALSGHPIESFGGRAASSPTGPRAGIVQRPEPVNPRR